MSSVIIKTATNEAMESSLVIVEGSFMSGFSGIQMVGSYSEICRSGLERARAALESLGIKIPARKILISLLPADLKKDGSQFDLPFALCLLALIHKKTFSIHLKDWLFAAELCLNGNLRPVRGIISYALCAMSEGLEGIIVAKEQLGELETLIRSSSKEDNPIKLLGFASLKEVYAWLLSKDPSSGKSYLGEKKEYNNTSFSPNFDDMLLSHTMKQVAMTSIVGPHNLCLYGMPGTGKSMFAERLISIASTLSGKEQIESLKIHSLHHSHLNKELLQGRPPFRSPHHHCSASAILGTPDHPGELALSHGGILFLDELPEFRRDIIEALREPLEQGQVIIARAQRKVVWKCKILLVVAANNCPCGWLGSSQRSCFCSTPRILAYKRKMSGPFLDRIDIHIHLKESPTDRYDFFRQLQTNRDIQVEQTKELAEKARVATQYSYTRNKRFGVRRNSELKAEYLLSACGFSEAFFRSCIKTLALDKMTTRGLIRCLRVSRSLADLESVPQVREQDLKLAASWSASQCAFERGDQAYGII